MPGVLQGIVDGVKGWGKYVNANGGIAGRKVQVDFIDSKLNPNDARNAIIKACGEDFALVGTGALLLQTPDDEISCPDATGKAIGIPDIAALVTNMAEACAPNAFPIVPNSVDCSTANSSPQTYRANNGDSKYLVKKFGKSARLVRPRRRLAVGGEDVHPAQQGGAAGRHQGRPRRGR